MTRVRSPEALKACARWWVGFWVWILFFAACSSPPSSVHRDLPSKPILCGSLGTDRVINRSLGESEVDRYEVALTAGDSLLLEASQDDVDLVVRIAGPKDLQPSVFDSPTGTMAPERVCTVAGRTGTYVVDVSPYSGTGAYSLRVIHIRPATESDRSCANGATAFAAAQLAKSRTSQAQYAERAGRLWEAAGESMLAAIAWRQVGQIWLDRGESSHGISSLERATSLARNSAYQRLETSILNRLALAYRDSGDLANASKTLDRALRLARNSDDARGLAAALNNRGLLDEDLGEPFRAVDRYHEAIEIWRHENDPGELAQALVNLATVLAVLDHHDEALDALGEALNLARAESDREHEAAVLTAIGWTHYLRGEPDQGLAPLREALRLRRALQDRKSEAGVLDRLGTLLLATGDKREAERSYKASLRISRQMDLPGYRAATENNLGCLLAGTDRTQEARDFLTSALDYFQNSGDLKSWSHSEYCMARLARGQGDIDRALKHIRRSLAIVESLRERARTAGHHYQPIWLWQDYDELELNLLLDRHQARGDPQDLSAAFAVADRMKARTLHELVVLTRSGSQRAANQSLEAHSRRLHDRLSSLGVKREALLRNGLGHGTTEVDDEIRRVRLALEFVNAKVQVASRGTDGLRMPHPVSAAEAQRLLDARTVLLTYVLGSERSHLFALTQNSLKVFDLDSREVLESYADAFYHALEEGRKPRGQWRLLSAALGQILLPPEAIPKGVDRLMIAPEGMLHYVPFAALASPRGASSGEVADRLVLDEFEVLTIPSAAVLRALRMRRERSDPPSRAVAIFADPVFSAADPRLAQPEQEDQASGRAEALARSPSIRGITTDRLPEGPLPRLPGTADEAAAILAYAPPGSCLVRLGPEATKQAVLSTDLRPFRIVHFATHAWIDERFPELSGLVLSTVDDTGRGIDGSLYLHEIDGLHLRAELTVLSGCQTALGRRVRGDGLVGLTQGFFLAGSSQVLVSLWSLDDTAAAKLMGELYRRMLKGGETPAAALRHSQQWLRGQAEFRAPRFWAPFVLQGDG